MTQLRYYPIGRQVPTYDIPEGVTVIGDYAFLYSKYLKQVTFPEGLTTIGKSAFKGVDIISLTFPSTLVTIEYNAFNSNAALTQVTIPENVLSLGDGAFSWCDKLTTVTVEGMYTDFNEYGVFDYGHDDLVIYGLEGSTAQMHAAEEEIDFQTITPTEGWICPVCNTGMTTEKFCWECGTARPEEAKEQICAGCGYVVPDDTIMKFCPECGTKFE